MERPSIGEKELELLYYISDCQKPVSVREVAEDFGIANDLARTTVLTLMERLREKGYLYRKKLEE